LRHDATSWKVRSPSFHESNEFFQFTQS
jgi:hypothetical protein